MGQTESVIAVILLALLAANWPFITQRLFGVLRLASGKSLFVRLLELIALYFVVGGIGLLFEQRLGQISPQKWEFYAITATAFITFAFPGFVWRYLMKRG
ncbi:DUF2818 family protein [Variovorax sp. PCZ-1]|uniref:DUF2818 family protein n=1 Tax=Variovorax sp. PCZ-1 TaxID=2835533 RepID=UPI001BCEEE82|nr:DUF2818 family protein [Variovorax sp. PCZ-1]MBS7807766.1 DUF2818 family protein [Variovorax sp. PCZ-1]